MTTNLLTFTLSPMEHTVLTLMYAMAGKKDGMSGKEALHLVKRDIDKGVLKGSKYFDLSTFTKSQNDKLIALFTVYPQSTIELLTSKDCPFAA